MLLNQDIALTHPTVLLVPYEPHHVPEYHAWMQNPHLQELTASEPLSLEEEYAMQASWRHDADKLTFIVCLPFADSEEEYLATDPGFHVKAGEDDSAEEMIGDINLFVSEEGGEDTILEGEGQQAGFTSSAGTPVALVAEVEIMIAKPGATGQGRGRAALLAFLRYVGEHEAEICKEYCTSRSLREVSQGPERFAYLRVKIGQGNVKSIGLFQSLGFAGAGEANVFGEIELRLVRDLREGLKVWEERWPGSVSKVREVGYERTTTVKSAEGTDDEMTG